MAQRDACGVEAALRCSVGWRRTQGVDPRGECFNEAAGKIARAFAREIAIFIEEVFGGADIGLRLRHGRDIETDKCLAKMMVGAKSADGTRRDRHHGGGLLAPDALAGGPRSNVERVLQCAGDGAIVFGRDEEQSIERCDALPKLDPFGRRIDFAIFAVEREVIECDELELEGWRREADQRVGHFSIVRIFAQTTDEYCNFLHGVMGRILLFARTIRNPRMDPSRYSVFASQQPRATV